MFLNWCRGWGAAVSLCWHHESDMKNSLGLTALQTVSYAASAASVPASLLSSSSSSSLGKEGVLSDDLLNGSPSSDVPTNSSSASLLSNDRRVVLPPGVTPSGVLIVDVDRLRSDRSNSGLILLPVASVHTSKAQKAKEGEAVRKATDELGYSPRLKFLQREAAATETPGGQLLNGARQPNSHSFIDEKKENQGQTPNGHEKQTKHMSEEQLPVVSTSIAHSSVPTSQLDADYKEVLPLFEPDIIVCRGDYPLEESFSSPSRNGIEDTTATHGNISLTLLEGKNVRRRVHESCGRGLETLGASALENREK
eukprot:GHVT01045017.1.p1 GENE.GHVT01045017.1~~GHVT01045017.1.p1  ORF type:complete len:310 (-),score=37.61 GHVT01045017.1:3930-4859(-)